MQKKSRSMWVTVSCGFSQELFFNQSRMRQKFAHLDGVKLTESDIKVSFLSLYRVVGCFSI